MMTETILQPIIVETYQPNFPMANNFFAHALHSRSLAHGYILKGRDSEGLYALALKVAQVLNCQNPPQIGVGNPYVLDDLACGTCTQCRWVVQNSHPTVLTVSRLTYLISEKGGDPSADELEKLSKKGSSATQIKAEQMDRLLSQLSLSTAYTRVIIFCDAEERGADYPSRIIPPFEWKSLESNADKSFHIRPLERSLFNAASANRFLKTLEEPPPRTIFFFLAETEEQLLETIVSRCQVVPCLGVTPVLQSTALQEPDRVFLLNFLNRCQSSKDVYSLAENFENVLMKERGLTLVQASEGLQTVLRTSAPLQDENAFRRYRQQLQRVETAIRMLDGRVNESAVLLDTILALMM